MNMSLNEYYVGITRGVTMAESSVAIIGEDGSVRCLHSSRLCEERNRIRGQIMKSKGFRDIRERDWNTCPNCGKIYKMRYRHKEEAPPGSIWFEQHMTGVCSDRCWDEFLGVTSEGI